MNLDLRATMVDFRIIVDLRMNETLQTGAVRKPHLPGGESVYLFLELTITIAYGHTDNG